MGFREQVDQIIADKGGISEEEQPGVEETVTDEDSVFDTQDSVDDEVQEEVVSAEETREVEPEKEPGDETNITPTPNGEEEATLREIKEEIEKLNLSPSKIKDGLLMQADYTRKRQADLETLKQARQINEWYNNPERLYETLREQGKIPEGVKQPERKSIELPDDISPEVGEYIKHLENKVGNMGAQVNNLNNFMQEQNAKNYANSLQSEFNIARKDYNIPENKFHMFHAYMDAGTRQWPDFTIDDALQQIAADMKADGIGNRSNEDLKKEVLANKELDEELYQVYIKRYLENKRKTSSETSSLSSMGKTKPVAKAKPAPVNVEEARRKILEDLGI